jgi:serine/threonine protein kinase
MEEEKRKNGEVLSDRYEILNTLYEGTYTTVYYCRDIRDNSVCAIKELWGGKISGEEKDIALKNFEYEVKILRTLRHQGIPRFIAHFSDETWHYLVMEYIEGKTLASLLEEKSAPFEIQQVLSWSLEVCDVFHFLHNRASPIIFRDLNPRTIMVTGAGTLKLIDFGLARFFDSVKDRDTYVLGTFGYAAPEQYGKKQTNPRTDIYALGATIYTLLTLQDVRSFLFIFPPVRRFNKKVPPWLERVISRCLEKEPEKRFKNALSLKDALAGGMKKLS